MRDKDRAYVRVADLTELPPGRLKLVRVNGRSVAMANIEGQIVALDNRCLHMGGPLAYGRLRGNELQCPWHGWRWDALTGRAIWPPVGWKLACYPVLVQGDDILVAET